ncbi:endonuclease/exonuclease/phosphatase family protein [Pontibacter diazotrophicus]|uniref:endonuclease/exonuclease/phosphatase family protein n=1 Tax=Pontibacter diazotrophicus TaxID=1400979 RepID=UPI001FE6EF09|nr:endonuclease/exonuclease/phosphatase family protein [Pontibacter diazotrophicus]
MKFRLQGIIYTDFRRGIEIDTIIIRKFAFVSDTFKKIRTRIWLILNIAVVLWVLLGVLCMQVPPYDFWPAGFIAFSLPGALVLNFLFLLYWALRRSWFLFLPLAVMVLGWTYYERLLPLGLVKELPPQDAKTLHVMSLNTHMFTAYHGKERLTAGVSSEMVDWVASHPADVYCLQEFYSNPNSKEYDFNIISRIGARYGKEHFFSAASSSSKHGDLGVAIFSKFPIVDKGVIHFSEKPSGNRAIWADLDMDGDTVRVYATHLQSMSIKAEDIENTYTAIGSDEESFKKEGRNVARRLRNGFVKRGYQVELLLEHFKTCPYPFVISGDYNDIPFSYTYNELAKELTNAFVEAGSGLGATYNGPLPFLRIDNQFYSDGLQAYEFETHYEMALSDHFPISAKYMLEPKEEE